MVVATTAGAASANNSARTRDDEVVDCSVLKLGDGPRRHLNLKRLAAGSGAQRAFAVAAATGLQFVAPSQRLKVTQRAVTDQHYVATAAAIAPVGTSAGYVSFAAERKAAIAATPSLRKDASLVVNHRQQTLGPASLAA